MMLIFSRDDMRNQSIWLEFPTRSHLLSPGSRDQCFGGERKEFGRGAHLLLLENLPSSRPAPGRLQFLCLFCFFSLLILASCFNWLAVLV